MTHTDQPILMPLSSNAFDGLAWVDDWITDRYHVLRNLLSMAGERAGRPLLMPATDGYGTATAHAIAGDGTWSRYPCVRAVDGR